MRPNLFVALTFLTKKLHLVAVIQICSGKKVFIRKHLGPSLFFNKVAGLRPERSSKKRFRQRCFQVNFVKFLRTPFLIEHLWWLPLYIIDILQVLQ